MGLYERVKGEKEESSNLVAPDVEAALPDLRSETRIELIENRTQVRTYQVTGSLNQDVSNLILDTIHPAIQMRTRVIYSFPCSIYRGKNQIVQYHRTLPTNGTFTNLSQIEDYILQCELQLLNLDDEGVWSKVYLPAVRITNNPRVYEGHVEFAHVRVRLIFSNEPLLGCGPLPDLCNQQHR